LPDFYPIGFFYPYFGFDLLDRAVGRVAYGAAIVSQWGDSFSMSHRDVPFYMAASVNWGERFWLPAAVYIATYYPSLVPGAPASEKRETETEEALAASEEQNRQLKEYIQSLKGSGSGVIPAKAGIS